MLRGRSRRSTPERKLREMRYAISVEKKYSKYEILTGYLNIVGFGGNVYGIQAAAEYYFGVSATGPQPRPVGDARRDHQQPVEPPHRPADEQRQRIGEPLRPDQGPPRLRAPADVRARARSRRPARPRRRRRAITPKITAATNGCATAVKYDAGYFCEYVETVVTNDKAFGTTADGAHRDAHPGRPEDRHDAQPRPSRRRRRPPVSASMPATRGRGSTWAPRTSRSSPERAGS